MPGLELNVVPDYKVFDGRFANNVWLQEMPDPVTKLTWDNAALISPATAKELGVETHDLVDLGLRGPPVHAPVYVLPGHADGAVTIALGYGRSGAETSAAGAGFDVKLLRRSDAPWIARGLTLTKTGRKHPLALTQEHWSMEGRDPAIDARLADYKKDERIEAIIEARSSFSPGMCGGARQCSRIPRRLAPPATPSVTAVERISRPMPRYP